MTTTIGERLAKMLEDAAVWAEDGAFATAIEKAEAAIKAMKREQERRRKLMARL